MEAEVEPSSSDADGTLLDLLIVMEKVKQTEQGRVRKHYDKLKQHYDKEVQRLGQEHGQGSAHTFTAATSNEEIAEEPELERGASNKQGSRSRSPRRGSSKGPRPPASPPPWRFSGGPFEPGSLPKREGPFVPGRLPKRKEPFVPRALPKSAFLNRMREAQSQSKSNWF